ncbi:hypothetical protein LS74_009745 [Helicobacter magdeburgensis]|uniref:Uncharacterized protein n=1 Tax=Helicobacter magdeburgensis TaxID=471858 RepID=A0A4U8SWR3_9HELI|nr:hypothetical protein [Helicobacter magdeburgensis]TLD91198.1 hypothetical protein LS74_009745 [Helicobacter magdeburgensis]
MIAQEVLLLTRSLLRDDDYKNLRFSDRELLDSMQRVQDELITLFRENIQVLCFKPKSAIFDLPQKVAYIHSITLNGTSIPYLQKHTAHSINSLVFTHLYENTYSILNYPIDKYDEISITYSALSEKIELNDELVLDSSYNKALSLGIVCEMFLREVNEINIQKKQFYEREYEKEKGVIRTHKNSSNNKRVMQTKTQY